MKNVFLSLCALVLIVLVAFPASAQQIKIAYVNSEVILRELPEAQAVKKKLETTINGWQDQLQQMQRDFQSEVDDYQKKQALMDPKAKADREKSLQDMQQKIIDFNKQKFDTRDGDAVKLREQEFQPIQDHVLDVIKAVAKEDGFNYVFDKLEAATNLLYADPKFDITYKVLDRLKRGSKAK